MFVASKLTHPQLQTQYEFFFVKTPNLLCTRAKNLITILMSTK